MGKGSPIISDFTIAENLVVGAFSFVNSNVPDNVVAVGVRPARVIKRLDEKESSISACI
jgi:serine acetyltransferase